MAFNNYNNNYNNARTSSPGYNKYKDPRNFLSASVEFANSAANLASGLLNSANDTDVIDQDMNIMSGNQYIPGYETLPRSPSDLFSIAPAVIGEIMGYDQDIRTQPLVDYDQENFKYSLDRQTDNSDFYYDDPLYVSFDLIFDDIESPLFNGEVDNFFSQYVVNNGELESARNKYYKFKELFFKIFNSSSYSDVKSNKVWYINSITGVDKLSAKIPKYEEDKITITLSEDISMLVNYMVDAYNNFAYNYSQQRYNLPDNLLRFKMSIQFTDMRTMKLLNHFEDPEYIYDKATQIYTLYDCNFDFFNAKNFTDEVIAGGYGVGKIDTPATAKFDVIYKSIQKEFRTPLLKNERGNIINNKDISPLTSNILNFRNNLRRTDENKSSASDIFKDIFGAANNLNNMLQNFAPNFRPPIPILPPNILGGLYDNDLGYTQHDYTLGVRDFEVPDPLQARKDLIEKFSNEIQFNEQTSLPSNIDLGIDYEQITTIPKQRPLGNDYEQITQPLKQRPLGVDYENVDNNQPHGDLGVISLFLKPPFSNTLGYVFQNETPPPNEDLGFDYENGENPTHGDLGVDYINDGDRKPLDEITLFGKETVNPSSLGYVFANIYELRNVNLGLDYDNTAERQQVSLSTLYENLSEKTQIDLGTDFVNEADKESVELKTVYDNETDKQSVELKTLYDNESEKTKVELNTLFDKTEKDETGSLDKVYDNISEDKPPVELDTLFEKTEKSKSELDILYDNDVNKEDVSDMGNVFSGTEKELTDDMGKVFDSESSERKISLNKVYDNESDEKQVDLGSDFVNEEIKREVNLGQTFINESGEQFVELDNVYINQPLEKENVELNTLFDKVEKPQSELDKVYDNTDDKNFIPEMGKVFDDDVTKEKLENMGKVFDDDKKPEIEDMGNVFSGVEKSKIEDMGNVFGESEKQLPVNMGNVFENPDEKLKVELDNVYDNISDEKETTNLDSVYSNTTNKNIGLNEDKVFEQKDDVKEELYLGSDYENVSDKKGTLDDDTIFPEIDKKPTDDLGITYENNISEEE